MDAGGGGGGGGGTFQAHALLLLGVQKIRLAWTGNALK